jgi:hypothetical protein
MTMPETERSPAAEEPEKRWKTTLLLFASAAFGGLAVALWDRRTLAGMRNRPPAQEVKPPDDEDAIY